MPFSCLIPTTSDNDDQKLLVSFRLKRKKTHEGMLTTVHLTSKVYSHSGIRSEINVWISILEPGKVLLTGQSFLRVHYRGLAGVSIQ